MSNNDLNLLEDIEFQNLSLELKIKLINLDPNLILEFKNPPNELIMFAINQKTELLHNIDQKWFLENEKLVSEILKIKKSLWTDDFTNFFSIFSQKEFSQEVQNLLAKRAKHFRYSFVQKCSKFFSQETLINILKLSMELFEAMDNADFKTSEFAILTEPSNIIYLSTNNVLTPTEKIKLYIMGLKKDPNVFESVSIVDSTNAHDAILKLENKLSLIQLMEGKPNE